MKQTLCYISRVPLHVLICYQFQNKIIAKYKKFIIIFKQAENQQFEFGPVCFFRNYQQGRWIWCSGELSHETNARLPVMRVWYNLEIENTSAFQCAPQCLARSDICHGTVARNAHYLQIELSFFFIQSCRSQHLCRFVDLARLDINN